ncbi:MAG: MBL fold metallo-hydrolase [Bacteroidales bacterium]|jgi:ribonuclease J
MDVTIYRGAEEIGGNCIGLHTGQTKILVDFGLPLDFQERSRQEQDKIRADAAVWAKDAHAVFISHSHADHYGLLPVLPKGTPVFMTPGTRMLLDCHPLSGIEPEETASIPVEPRQPFTFRDIAVTAYDVDHSAYGACAFCFQAEGTSVLYSGDIRLHGRKGGLHRRLPRQVDYLLLEGTNIGAEKACEKETALEERFAWAFTKAAGSLHLVWCSSQNIDRMVTLYKACLQSRRRLVVDPYTAVVLDRVAGLSPTIPNVLGFDRVKVYYPKKLTTYLHNKYGSRYTTYLQPGVNKVTYKDLMENPGAYVMVVRPSSLDYLKRLSVPSIRFTLSTWRGYWEQDLPGTMKFREWVETHCHITEDIHTSGHADAAGLRRIVEHVRPKHIIPIHTEHAALFSQKIENAGPFIVLYNNTTYTL